jgi:adenosylmethionine-8-amino-7-oxononanoate aminotransferase
VAKGYEEGVIVRPLTNLLAMSPPLVLSENEVDQFVSGLKRAVDAVTNEVAAAKEHAA